MLAVVVIAAVVVLATVVFVAAGHGDAMPATEVAGYAPIDLGPVSATDVVLLRPPTALWGYDQQATDQALGRIAESIRERDIRIVALEQRLADLGQGRAPATAPGSPYGGGASYVWQPPGEAGSGARGASGQGAAGQGVAGHAAAGDAAAGVPTIAPAADLPGGYASWFRGPAPGSAESAAEIAAAALTQPAAASPSGPQAAGAQSAAQPAAEPATEVLPAPEPGQDGAQGESPAGQPRQERPDD